MLNTVKTFHLHICVGAIALMVAIPFLIAHHYNPIPSFFQEWTAAALSFVAFTVLLWRGKDRPLEIPEIAFIPIGLMIIAVLQLLLLPDVLTDRLLLFSCYMVWTTLLVIVGRQLVQAVGLQAVADIIATALLVGALLEAFSGGVQAAGLARMPWFFPASAGGLKGNLAQPNNFADYLWLGVCSAVYLRGRSQLGVAATAASLLILLSFAILSGSRSVWLYGVGLAVLSTFWAWRKDKAIETTLRNWSIAALLASLICQLAFSSGLITLPGNIVTSGTRMADSSYDPIRIALWRVALETFLENPILGAGVGQYTHQFHLHVLELMPARLPGLPEHAHNIVFHLLAEMGFAAGLIFLFFGIRWTISLARAPRNPGHWWIAAIMMVLGIHANLEYPLWYGFFLGIAAVLAGAASQNNRVQHLERKALYAIVAFLALGALALCNLYRDYSLLEDTLNGRMTVDSPDERRKRTMDTLQHLARESLLRPYVDLTLAHLMADDTDDLEIKLGNCERAQRFSASRDIVFKCAHLLTLAGRDDEGQQALRRAVAAYPEHAERILEQWKSRSPNEPAIARLVANFPPIAAALSP